MLTCACAMYVAGVLGVTGVGNVPLNNALDEFDLDAATIESIAARRRSYETPWNRWHYARTDASMLVFATAVAASLVEAEQE